jgi:3-deoxy-manno-octulosonate cytidylyltransferase (CMP-KDO synthetase)
VQHVVDQVRGCRRIARVIVAADHPRIVDAVSPYGTHVVLTDPAHPSGTDRIAEVAAKLPDDIIINVQGDEPEIQPQIVDDLAARLEQSGDDMATVATPFPADADPADPNLVKVVRALDGRAMYFSRSVVPFQRDPQSGGRPAYLLHLGIYAYRRRFLLELASWKPTPCEVAEKLEQLRVLEHGRTIHVLLAEHRTQGIDTPQQYAQFVKRWRANHE